MKFELLIVLHFVSLVSFCYLAEEELSLWLDVRIKVGYI